MHPGVGEPDHQTLGRSRGGWSSKTHLARDHHLGVLPFQLTPGEGCDYPQMVTVLTDIQVTRPRQGPVPIGTG